MNKSKVVGLVLVILSMIFVTAETAYFGWNFFPKSVAEQACDYVALAMMIMGFIIFGTSGGEKTTCPKCGASLEGEDK